MTENDANSDKFVALTRRGRVPETTFYEAIFAMYETIWQNLLPPQVVPAELTVKLARNVVTPPETPVPDCVTCGVCCAAMLCVGVRPGEEQRLDPEVFWDVTSDDDSLVVDRFLRRESESLMCAQLDVGADGRTTCRIYETRPRMCRDFDAGSDKCHALRRAYGVEPFLGLDEMSAANARLDARPPRFDEPNTIRAAKFVRNESGRVSIVAHLMNDTTRTIHEFEPQTETYLQFEFDALTLDEAARLIAERRPTALTEEKLS